MIVAYKTTEGKPTKMAKNTGDSDLQEISREYLMRVASQLTGEWKMVGRYLGLSEPLVHNITCDYLGNQAEAKLQMLLLWKQRKGTFATQQALDDALAKAHGLYLKPEGLTEDKKQLLIAELQCYYTLRYEEVQPIPYIRDRLCVNRVFVEPGIQYLVAKGMFGSGDKWENLESHQNIFTDQRVKSTRRILEGEPGYGKSTLTIQLAYDWCNKIDASALSKVELFILLRLLQLGEVQSIYTAIKQFLLPIDSSLTEGDIEDIVCSSKSVVVVFDGFDEYQGSMAETSSNEFDVINILQEKMFQKVGVILTTRSSCLPKEYMHRAKRIRLTGFDDRARDQYLRKAVVGDYAKAMENIKGVLKDNALLDGLSQVPLFFTMLAHMSHESEQLRQLKSVTSLFRYIISCFHSHMQNKMKVENVKKFDLCATEHQELNKIAFEGLIKKKQQIVWKKEELIERLGEDFYNQYVSVGMLIEEEELHFTDQPSTLITEHVQYKTKVRLYHKLFCEWYAAHYLADFASKEDVTFNLTKTNDSTLFFSQDVKSNAWNTDPFLQHFDPIDLQFLYRFACGLNPVAGRKIIEYLKDSTQGEQFAILCISEQEGNVQSLLRAVQHLYSGTVAIVSHFNLLMQRSIIQLLEIASSNEITIPSLVLDRCFQSVDLQEECLCLTSGLRMPRLNTLQDLCIRGDGDRCDHSRDLLDYSARCISLQSVRFGSYFGIPVLLPQSFDDKDVLASLHKKNCEVEWRYEVFIGHGEKVCYWKLNLRSGKWEDADGEEMADEEYQLVYIQNRGRSF